MFECKVLELDEANVRVSTLELKVSNLVDSLKEKDKLLSFSNTNMKLSSEKILIYEAKCERLEKEISNLKAEVKSLKCEASTSQRCEAETVSNEKLKTLESFNSKLRDIIKKFTTSQTSFNTLMGNMSNNANKHGLGYMPKVQPLKPKKTNTRKFLKFTHFPSSYCNDDVKYVETHKKSLCHHCNKLGHVSFDCFTFYNPFEFMWVMKNSANTVDPSKGYQWVHLLLRVHLLLQVHLQAPNDQVWILDSGCSNHMMANKSFFTSLSRVKDGGAVTIGDGDQCKIIVKGTIGKDPNTVIENVNLVEGLAHNLLSIAHICPVGFKVVFDKAFVFIMKGDKILFKGSSHNNIYTIDLSNSNNLKCLVVSSEINWL